MIFKKKKKNEAEKTGNSRKFPRARFYQNTYCMMTNSQELETFPCLFHNISEGGICFETDNQLPPEENTVKVLYKLGKKFRDDMVAVRHYERILNTWRYGCEFLSSDEGRSGLINEVIGQS